MPQTFEQEEAIVAASSEFPPLEGSRLPYLLDPFQNDDQPLRLQGHRHSGEVGLEEVARRVASASIPAEQLTRRALLDRVRRNHRLLVSAHHDLSVAVRGGEQPSPDAEWLLDNFYIIDEVFREVLTDLPQGYYDELPALGTGPFAGLPRTYALAIGLLIHTDSSLSDESLTRYVQAWQTVEPLTIGEIWAVPIMLRVGLLENLGRLARQMHMTRLQRNCAHDLVRRLISGQITTLPDHSVPGNNPCGEDAFVVGLQHALRDQHEVKADLDERIRSWLAQLSIDPNEITRREHQRQAANQVSIGNAVTSLRLLSVVDWTKFFEDVSVVEQILRAEPTGVYTRQTFATRDSYRAAIERFARGSGRTKGSHKSPPAPVREQDVARLVIEKATSQTEAPRNHLGYYLVGSGQKELGYKLGYHPRPGFGMRQGLQNHPNVTWFGLLTILTLGIITAVIALASPATWLGVLGLTMVLILPASEVAVAMANFLLCRLLPPRTLPRLDFREGIPSEFGTFVVIPGMLTNPKHAQTLLDKLELHCLANPDSNLYFAVLTDFADAPAETMPGDEECIQAALEAVRKLNEKHAAVESPRFFVLHRRRLYNASEGCWMGWERKRGKLHEFNRLIRGAIDTSYAFMSADVVRLPQTRYVLTLDSDTVMAPDTVRILVGTMAHPLNTAHKEGRRIVSGYGVLQPRVSFLYGTGFRSLFARLYAWSAGIDPYSAAVSDTWMDLFGRGTFSGKGLYDVDAFEATAGHAFPDNQILSHDLIEGNFARCALVSDVEVFDDFPSSHTVYSRREHRWTRGDWQLLPWLGSSVPTAHEGRKPNPLPLLERWKILDNLRRTLVPPACVLLLALGWTVLPGTPLLWTLLVMALLAVPLGLHLLGVFLSIPIIGVRLAWVSTRAGLISTIGQMLLSGLFLAQQAWSLLDAIGRAVVRTFVTHRKLLEWETAAATESRLSSQFVVFLREMWAGSLTALVLCVTLAYFETHALLAASPFLLGWFLSPVVSWWISRPRIAPGILLEEADRPRVRELACKTWSFFEVFVGDEDHWLPPDNYQQEPVEAIAHRTSPTNIGLLLTSTLAAHDLGFISLTTMIGRVENTLRTLHQLERFRGHFLNWYDTRSLVPLPPAYVSSVDSGNLLGCLLVLSQGLLEKLRCPIPSPHALEGLRDRFQLIQQAGQTEGRDHPLAGEEISIPELLSHPADLAGWNHNLTRLLEITESWVRQPAKNPESALRIRGFAEAIRLQQEELAALYSPSEESQEKPNFPMDLETLAASGQKTAVALIERTQEMIRNIHGFCDEMDFRFLYNSTRQLFSIGYHVPRASLDQAHYDLLASEACLTSFLAVARGEAPRKHWFRLGRLFIRVAGQSGLMSWSGTMFEYLMPRLVLPVPEGTLLDIAWRAAVARQIEYGIQTRVPWGISESAYNLTDTAGNYQYQAFGVPGLGLKRGLSHDLVVAPYATVLAIGIAPNEAMANIKRLAGEGAEGMYGLYEALDYTPDRLLKGQKFHLIRSFMAHHQGMSLLAIANALQGNLMSARLAREPIVRAVSLLLQERVPLDAPVVQSREEQQTGPLSAEVASDAVSRCLTTPAPREPRPHLLSNGRYTVMFTSSGAGSSTCGEQDVTRWRADVTTDSWGQFYYLRNRDDGEMWSVGHQPVGKVPEEYEVIYSIDKIELRRRDRDIGTLMEIAVSPEHNAEVRRITLINHSDELLDIDVTSYAEIVLAPHMADLAHPAFHKLFLETQWLAEPKALLCRRRPRSVDQAAQWAVHILTTDNTFMEVEYETDRAQFIGRHGNLSNPRAMQPEQRLSSTVGAVLDPIFSIRCHVQIPAFSRSVVSFTTAVVSSFEEAVQLANIINAPQEVERIFELSWAHSRVELKHFNLSIREAQLYQRLAGHVMFPTPSLRPPASVLLANRQGQAGLWRHGISGDLPIVLVRLGEGAEAIELFRRLVNAHSYWRAKGLLTDLVVLNEAPTTYLDPINEELLGLIRASESRDRINRPGGVFVRKSDQFSADDLILLQTWARVILTSDRGSLEDQVGMTSRTAPLPDRFRPNALVTTQRKGANSIPATGELQFFNGFGGFSPDGREYVILASKQSREGLPPAPWVNVIANPVFGFLISESGAGYTWAQNSQLNRLTPWHNDPVCDPPGEVVYLRDEQTGEVWSPTPLPFGNPSLVRHGAGYTSFEQHHGKLEQKLTLFVPSEDSVKIYRLHLNNQGTQARILSVTFYVEWVLGTHHDQTAMHITTAHDPECGAIFAFNPMNEVMAPSLAFAAISPIPTSVSADRNEFLGRNGRLSSPAALTRANLSGRTGAGMDPCAALQTQLTVEPGQSIEVICLLGQVADTAAARRLIERYRTPQQIENALVEVTNKWDELLGVVQVTTPDIALNLLLNRWLLYQVVSCRLWGRTGFYQSGGAYGFRDQLQDVMALAHAAPQLAREQILRAAKHQFREGDVQHWWHPMGHGESGPGVRTRFSDDFLWLAFVACDYAKTTGDDAIFEEQVAFLEAPLLEPHQDEAYGQARSSTESAPLYEHCLRALEHGWKQGEHGLPLMGIGDWNDGMNRVGSGGKGESVWVAWFQSVCLEQFADLAERRQDTQRMSICRERAAHLREAAENAWDGHWYRRAYFDDGTPLGSSENTECRIDSIVQSWAVLAGGNEQRVNEAMKEAVTHLVRHEDRVILLFDPPFDDGPLQPGYIKGYIPGTRENGGQYTHAAIWLLQAATRLGQTKLASDLLGILNPIRHGDSTEKVRRYKVEPYVVAADIYGRSPLVGRGGWTWYTGSAGWLYQVALRDVLGLERHGNRLRIKPCLPDGFGSFEISFRFGKSLYRLVIDQAVSGQETPQHVEEVLLVDDGQTHEIRIGHSS